MSRRLVIPAGDTPSSPAPYQGLTWQQVADANHCDSIENAGSAWCVANGINGLGIATEAPPAPPPPDPTAIDPFSALALVRLIDQSGADTVADLRAAAAEAAGVV
jgi:hypothetical protein